MWLLLWQPKGNLQLFCCWCVGSRPEKESPFALAKRRTQTQWLKLSVIVQQLSSWTEEVSKTLSAFFFFSIPQSNHTISALISSVKVAFTFFKAKLPTSSLFSLFFLPCYVTTSLILFPNFSKADWSTSHQAFCGTWCVWAEFTILCFIVTSKIPIVSILSGPPKVIRKVCPLPLDLHGGK